VYQSTEPIQHVPGHRASLFNAYQCTKPIQRVPGHRSSPTCTGLPSQFNMYWSAEPIQHVPGHRASQFTVYRANHANSMYTGPPSQFKCTSPLSQFNVYRPPSQPIQCVPGQPSLFNVYWSTEPIQCVPGQPSLFNMYRSTEPIQCVLGHQAYSCTRALSLGVKWPGNEIDHSHSSSAKISQLSYTISPTATVCL
jgi:hypothetical protein